MTSKLQSPRTHCLRCGCAISAQQLAAHGIHDRFYGFCGPAHEINFAVALDEWKRSAKKVSSLLDDERRLLVEIAQKTLTTKVASLLPVQQEALVSLAKQGLVVRHGKLSAQLTVLGEISYIYGRVDRTNLAVAAEGSDQDPDDEPGFANERDFYDEEELERDAETAFEQHRALVEHGFNWKR